MKKKRIALRQEYGIFYAKSIDFFINERLQEDFYGISEKCILSLDYPAEYKTVCACKMFYCLTIYVKTS